MAQQRRLINAQGFEQEQDGGKAAMGDPGAVPEVGGQAEWQTPPDAKIRQPQPGGGDVGGFGGLSQSQTKPREMSMGQGGGQNQPTPARPRQPQPAQGAISPAPMGGVIPFEPMAGPDLASMASPVGGGLYGSLGGLKGGGLGVPLDPINDAQEDPLSGLIQMLLKSRG